MGDRMYVKGQDLGKTQNYKLEKYGVQKRNITKSGR
jgi:hypothetical protein